MVSPEEVRRKGLEADSGVDRDFPLPDEGRRKVVEADTGVDMDFSLTEEVRRKVLEADTGVVDRDYPLLEDSRSNAFGVKGIVLKYLHGAS